MTEQKRDAREIGKDLIRKVLELGADKAGLASVRDLRNGPSEQLFPKMKDHARDHFAEQITTGLPHGAVKWQENERSAPVELVPQISEVSMPVIRYCRSCEFGCRIGKDACV